MSPPGAPLSKHFIIGVQGWSCRPILLIDRMVPSIHERTTREILSRRGLVKRHRSSEDLAIVIIARIPRAPTLLAVGDVVGDVAAAEAQDAFVAQRCERAAGAEVTLRAEPLVDRKLQNGDLGWRVEVVQHAPVPAQRRKTGSVS